MHTPARKIRVPDLVLMKDFPAEDSNHRYWSRPHCDGQVLVSYDILGLFDKFVPPFVKQYAQLGEAILNAARSYPEEVREGVFPHPRRQNHCRSQM